MAVLTKEQFMEVLKTRVGDSTDDGDLKFLEDFTDTYNDLESKQTSDPDAENWKQKYEENDAAWRTRYKERFFSAGKDTDTKEGDVHTDTPTGGDAPEYKPEQASIDDIFINPGEVIAPGIETVGMNL